MTSIFYGHPLSDSLLGIKAIDLYLTTGFVYHHSSDPFDQTLNPGEGINTVELAGLGNNSCDGVSACTITYDLQSTKEYVLGIKAYYNARWPMHGALALLKACLILRQLVISNREKWIKKVIVQASL